VSSGTASVELGGTLQNRTAFKETALVAQNPNRVNLAIA